VIAIRQTVSSNPAGSASSVAATITVLARSSLHVCCSCDDAFVFTTCTDGTNTYTLRDQIDDSTNTKCAAQFTADNVPAGTYTVTANISGSTTNRCIAVREITQTVGWQDNSSQIQPNPTTATDATTSNNSGALTLAASLVSGFCVRTVGSGAPASGTGFTDDGALWPGSIDSRFENMRVITGGGGAAATFTAAANVTHLSFCAIFTEMTPLFGGYCL
jgi:hypothetical protein